MLFSLLFAEKLEYKEFSIFICKERVDRKMGLVVIIVIVLIGVYVFCNATKETEANWTRETFSQVLLQEERKVTESQFFEEITEYMKKAIAEKQREYRKDLEWSGPTTNIEVWCKLRKLGTFLIEKDGIYNYTFPVDMDDSSKQSCVLKYRDIGYQDLTNTIQVEALCRALCDKYCYYSIKSRETRSFSGAWDSASVSEMRQAHKSDPIHFSLSGNTSHGYTLIEQVWCYMEPQDTYLEQFAKTVIRELNEKKALENSKLKTPF